MFRPSMVSLLRWSFPLAAAALLGACASAPIYPPEMATVHATPTQVAQSPEHYSNGNVIWGGRIIKVENLSDHTEVEIFAYPLDASQQPQTNDTGNGRFIAWLPGYVERFNYPAGGLVTLHGHIKGVRSGHVGGASYVFPLIDTTTAHVWTPDELQRRRPNVHFGVGVGIGIR